MRKIRIPMSLLEESHNPKRVEEDRSIAIEAAIVRIMKVRSRVRCAVVMCAVFIGGCGRPLTSFAWRLLLGVCSFIPCQHRSLHLGRSTVLPTRICLHAACVVDLVLLIIIMDC
jgi:hypothetical protein